MRRIQYYNYGGADEMRLEEVEAVPPRERQILVRVRAASVNPTDWQIRSGMMKFATGRRFPRAVGRDFSGIVADVGPGVSRIKPGDAVLGMLSMKQSGSFADYVVAEEKRVVLKPASLSFQQAATLPVAGCAAWCALVNTAKIEPGQSVFIHGCLGSVGRAAVQIAYLMGAEVAGSCRASALAEAGSLGIDPIVDFNQIDVEALKSRFDVIFDTAGTLPLNEGRAMLKKGGVVLDINPTLSKKIVSQYSPFYTIVTPRDTPEILNKLVEAAAAGKLRLPITRVAALAVAVDAIRELEETGIPKGKLVIVA